MSLLIDEETLERRLENAEIIYRRMGQGSDGTARPRGDNFKSGIPHFVREVIAGEARAECGTHAAIAESWGISETSVKNIEDARIGRHELRGVDSALDIVANENAKLIEDEILTRTNEKILHTITSMDNDAIAGEKPIAQSVIARNLANILDRLRPKQIGPNLNIAFTVFTPPEINLNHFGEPIRVIEKKDRS